MKYNEPLVSVIMPAYNSIYIREAIDSVLSQTYRAIELIVVNDGSTDETDKVLESYRGIKVIETENRGAAAARNEGLRVSNGELISFLDSDDEWLHDKTENQVQFLADREDLDFLYGRFENYFQEGNNPPPGINKEKFLRPETGEIMMLGSLTIRKEAADKVGPFNPELRTGEDLDWFIRIKEVGLKGVFDRSLVLKRRLHGSNLSYEGIAQKSNLTKLLKSSMDRKRI